MTHSEKISYGCASVEDSNSIHHVSSTVPILHELAMSGRHRKLLTPTWLPTACQATFLGVTLIDIYVLLQLLLILFPLCVFPHALKVYVLSAIP